MQLHYTDAAHVGRSRVMESLRFADCSECRAVSKAESTEQRPAEAAHIYRKQQRPQRSELTILVELQLMRLASAPYYAAHERPEVSGLALVLQRLSIQNRKVESFTIL